MRLPARFSRGDTIYSQSELLERRESKSHPNVGIGTVKTTGYNQDSMVVITFRRTIMIYKRRRPQRSLGPRLRKTKQEREIPNDKRHRNNAFGSILTKNVLVVPGQGFRIGPVSILRWTEDATPFQTN